MKNRLPLLVALWALVVAGTLGCSDDDGDGDGAGTATVAIHNDFDNTEFERRPPWTLCEVSYGGTEFGSVDIGDTSDEQEVTAGLDYVLMVAAWDDPTCAEENTLPIASRNEEEVVSGQTRTIAINVPNHQGPCPPEGVQPIPEDLYDRVLELWPDYGFLPYAQRTENPQCLE